MTFGPKGPNYNRPLIQKKNFFFETCSANPKADRDLLSQICNSIRESHKQEREEKEEEEWIGYGTYRASISTTGDHPSPSGPDHVHH